MKMRWDTIKEKLEELGYEVKEKKKVNLHRIDIKFKVNDIDILVASAYKDWELSAQRTDNHLRGFSLYIDNDKNYTIRYDPTSLDKFYGILSEISKKEKSINEIINKKEILRAEKELKNLSFQAYRSENAYFTTKLRIEELKGDIDFNEYREKYTKLGEELREKYNIEYKNKKKEE